MSADTILHLGLEQYSANVFLLVSKRPANEPYSDGDKLMLAINNLARKPLSETQGVVEMSSNAEAQFFPGSSRMRLTLGILVGRSALWISNDNALVLTGLATFRVVGTRNR